MCIEEFSSSKTWQSYLVISGPMVVSFHQKQGREVLRNYAHSNSWALIVYPESLYQVGPVKMISKCGYRVSDVEKHLVL